MLVLAEKIVDGTKVKLVTPPEEANIGEKVFIDSLTGDPATSAQMKKKKSFAIFTKSFKTGDSGVAIWEGKVLKTSAG
jgi:aminoacyl tRNA synthase complex-interacting multifunctional protein 1